MAIALGGFISLEGKIFIGARFKIEDLKIVIIYANFVMATTVGDDIMFVESGSMEVSFSRIWT